MSSKLELILATSPQLTRFVKPASNFDGVSRMNAPIFILYFDFIHHHIIWNPKMNIPRSKINVLWSLIGGYHFTVSISSHKDNNKQQTTLNLKKHWNYWNTSVDYFIQIFLNFTDIAQIAKRTGNVGGRNYLKVTRVSVKNSFFYRPPNSVLEPNYSSRNIN